MKPVYILLFILAISTFYVVIKRYKKEQTNNLEKSKEAVQEIIDRVPKKMKKVIVTSKDTFPAGLIKLGSIVGSTNTKNSSKEEKIIEAFEDIKDIRYGKIGASNHNGGNTVDKWIKIAAFTISGAWDPRGFTLEVYPRIRYHSSSRQTLVCLVRNNDKDVELPYVSLNTNNESEPNTRLIKDAKVIRVSGSGITDNKIEVWIQFASSWADTAYVMYYLYNFKTKDFVATLPQAMSDSPPGGQSWGINERTEPLNGKNPISVGKGNGWSTAININAPQQPESLYSLHFGDGTDIHGRQAGMGYIKDQPNRIWGATRGTLATHIHQDDDLHLYSSGWTPLFSIKGGSGDTYHRGNVNVGGAVTALGGAQLEGTVRFRRAGANGDDNSDPYYIEKIQASSNNNSLRLTINDDADESFQIWGNSCGAGNCAGPGTMQHNFVANGDAIHAGNVSANRMLEKRNKARFIRVGNKDASLRKDYWTLIELRAYDHNGNNVAQGKSVQILEGRKWADQTPPERIVDGQIFDTPPGLHDNWYKGYHGDTGLNVLQIDLGTEVDLAQLELFNRWHADVDWRMDGTTIELIGADGNRNRIIYTGLWHRQYSKEYLL